ncbi:MAG: hypothetical protein J6U54_08805 [Clostridiales bacterium]|nr:hypothetical protein [Clostridiales bacterium]
MSEIEITESILYSVKKQLGGLDPTEESPFDADIIMQINGVFGILQQLGVGPKEGFSISDETATWTDFVGDDKVLNMIKPYMYAKVKLGFDIASTPSSVITALENIVHEYEFRMNVRVDPGDKESL